MPQLDSSAFWGIAGIVVGLVVATFFFIIGKKKTLLQYDISTTPLITEQMALYINKPLNTRMFIDGQPVESLSATTIRFVNSGNQRIQSSEFSVQNPLCIFFEGHLYGYVSCLGNQNLSPKLEPVNKNELNISFENLKPRQFFSVTIFHDEPLEVLGELTTGTMREHRKHKISYIFMIILAIVISVLQIDYTFSGPVFLLIGEIEDLLLRVLFIIYPISVIVDTYKSRREEDMFMS